MTAGGADLRRRGGDSGQHPRSQHPVGCASARMLTWERGSSRQPTGNREVGSDPLYVQSSLDLRFYSTVLRLLGTAFVIIRR